MKLKTIAKKYRETILIYSLMCFSQSPLFAESQTTGEFSIDKNLIPYLYESTVQEARGENNSKLHSSFITPQISIVMPIEMHLANGYFTVPYEKNISSLPMLSLISSTSSPIIKTGRIETYGQASIGYGYTEGIYDVQSKAEMDLKDTVKLHWIPALVTLRTEYSGLSSFGLNLFLTGGAGGQWLYQSGMLDGMQQGFWIPTTQVGAGFTIFGHDSRDLANFFQGIRLGATYQKSILSSQKLSAWSVDIGTSLLL